MSDKPNRPFYGFRIGLWVRITDGKFAGKEGMIIGPDIMRLMKLSKWYESKRPTSFCVLVKHLHGETVVELDPEQMSPL